MPKSWEINAEWEYLDSGLPEERACFAALSIYAHAQCLTEGRDARANRLRKAPYLSAYPFAEWLAWNWWRLRWNTGRRFELARLLGDRLLADPGDRLFPATRAYTYRQNFGTVLDLLR